MERKQKTARHFHSSSSLYAALSVSYAIVREMASKRRLEEEEEESCESSEDTGDLLSELLSSVEEKERELEGLKRSLAETEERRGKVEAEQLEGEVELVRLEAEVEAASAKSDLLTTTSERLAAGVAAAEARLSDTMEELREAMSSLAVGLDGQRSLVSEVAGRRVSCRQESSLEECEKAMPGLEKQLQEQRERGSTAAAEASRLRLAVASAEASLRQVRSERQISAAQKRVVLHLANNYPSRGAEEEHEPSSRHPQPPDETGTAWLPRQQRRRRLQPTQLTHMFLFLIFSSSLSRALPHFRPYDVMPPSFFAFNSYPY